MAAIATRYLWKVYGQGETRTEALRGVTLSVMPGEYVAVTGPSGSGKSTLLHLLSALDLPTSGQVLLDGRDLAAMNDDQRTIMRRERVAMVFQSFNLLPILTAEENVALPLLLAGENRSSARERAGEALAAVGLLPRRHHIPSQLSGGEQQRVAIARGLVISPTILLADEPTGNLDTEAGSALIQLVRRLVDQRGQSVLLITHDPHVASTADRILQLRDGRIASDENKRVAR